jgi:hypothetical protein
MIKNEISTDNYYSFDVECDICGAGPLNGWVAVVSSIPNPRRGKPPKDRDALYEDRQNYYEACFDCLKAGPETFPDRLREHARTLEEEARKRVQQLRQLANAEWSSVLGQTYADIIRYREEDE